MELGKDRIFSRSDPNLSRLVGVDRVQLSPGKLLPTQHTCGNEDIDFEDPGKVNDIK